MSLDFQGCAVSQRLPYALYCLQRGEQELFTMPNRRGARRRMRGGLSGVDELEVQDEKMKTTSSGLEQVQGGLPAAISGTWVVINQKLLASQKAAVQRFDASRKRVDALRHMLARQRMQFFVERKRRREVQRAARILVGLGSHDDTLNFTVGAFLFGLMAFMAGAAPGLLPMFNVVFFVCMLPARAIYFIHRKWIFFLIDFCYVRALHSTAAHVWYSCQ